MCACTQVLFFCGISEDKNAHNIHAHNIHAHNIHAHNIHVHNIHVHSIHAHNIHAHNIHAYTQIMQVEFLSEKREFFQLDLRLTGVDLSFVNGLRRILMSEIPCFAIHDVIEYTNTSTIKTERIAHILGLVPICVPGVDLVDAERAYRLGDREAKKKIALRFQFRDRCENQAQCSPSLTYRQSTSALLKWMPRTTEESLKPVDERPAPVYGTFTITNLTMGTEIDTDAICIPGTGMLNAKWSPVCTCFFRLEKAAPRMLAQVAKQDFLSGTVSASEYVERFMHPGQQGVIAKDEIFTYPEVELEEEEEDEEMVRDVSQAEDDGDTGLLFTLETKGVVTPQDALKYALRIYNDKIMTLIQAFRTETGI
jgi:DNA-directed RNA polymerase I and III subunit RPAC1